MRRPSCLAAAEDELAEQQSFHHDAHRMGAGSSLARSNITVSRIVEISEGS